MKTLDTFDFGSRGERKSSYDWDTILSGKIVVLVEGEDYICKKSTMTIMARNKAKKLGKKLRTGKDFEGNLIVQAVSAEGEAKPAAETRRRRKSS